MDRRPTAELVYSALKAVSMLNIMTFLSHEEFEVASSLFHGCLHTIIAKVLNSNRPL